MTEQFDFLVIGGGIAGVSAGARLARLGTVALLEAETALGYHASGRSAAMFEETYGKPSTIALNRASKDFLMQENGGVLSPRGLMLVGLAGQDAGFEDDLSTMKMQELSPADANGMVPVLNPETVTRIGHRADAWDIDTDLLIQNFARNIRGNGEVTTNAKVTAMSHTKNGWATHVGERTIEGRTLINAAGAWADEVAQIAGVAPLGFQPHRRSMARIPAPGGHDVSDWPMMFGVGETWYAKPDAGRLIVSPADEDPMPPMDAWPDDMVLAEGLARYQEAVTEPVTRLETSWAGLRTFSPDRCLVIGPDPEVSDFVWCAGQGGYGFQSSPAASQYLADVIAGEPSQLDAQTQAALSPNRFK